MAKKYLLYIHDSERFDKEKNKSGLVNTLLDDWYGRIKNPENPYPKNIVSRVKPLDIPGVEKASEARCKGTHYMSRVDCGKPGCPWK